MVHRKSWPPPPPRPAKPKRKRKQRRGNNGNWRMFFFLIKICNSFSRGVCVYKGGIYLPVFFSKFCGESVSHCDPKKSAQKQDVWGVSEGLGESHVVLLGIWIFFPQQCGSFAFGWVEAFLAEKVIHSGKGAKGWFFQMFWWFLLETEEKVKKGKQKKGDHFKGQPWDVARWDVDLCLSWISWWERHAPSTASGWNGRYILKNELEEIHQVREES